MLKRKDILIHNIRKDIYNAVCKLNKLNLILTQQNIKQKNPSIIFAFDKKLN